ncbi:retrotransposon protein, putative, ty1-copia subclass [Tanacetum coccineum]
MYNSKRGSIPMQVDLHLSKFQCATTSAEMKRMQNVHYASAVGSIMYAARSYGLAHDSVIVEALKVDSLQRLTSSLEPLFGKIVSEEVERALTRYG